MGSEASSDPVEEVEDVEDVEDDVTGSAEGFVKVDEDDQLLVVVVLVLDTVVLDPSDESTLEDTSDAIGAAEGVCSAPNQLAELSAERSRSASWISALSGDTKLGVAANTSPCK
jgi:hypothetical protein